MSSDPRGSLYLLPNTLGETAPEAVISAAALNRARSLDYLIAEDPKTTRAFLKRIGSTRALQSIRVERLDHNTPAADIASLLEPVLAGRDAGLLSEAGLPAVADPGAGLVRLAHERNVRVVPLSGPSSIVLALAAARLVCVAGDMARESKTVKTRSIAAWRKVPPQLRGRPTVFLFLA